MARARPYDAIVLDVMLPGLDGFAVCRELRGGRGLDTGPVPDRARRAGRPRRGARRRRRRLSRQAVLVPGAACTASRRLAARRGREADRPRGRIAPARSGSPPSLARRDRARALGEGVRPARAVHAPSRAGDLPRRADRRAWDIAYESRSNVVDVYVRYLREKIDRPFGYDSLETVRGVGYRLSAENAERLADPRAPRRGLLGGDGGSARRARHLRLPPRGERAAPLRRSEPASAGRRVVAARARRPAHRRRRAESGTIVEVLDASGRVVRSAPTGLPPLIDRADGAAKLWHGRVLVTVSRGPGESNDWRALAQPVSGGVIVVARSLRQREETLHHVFRVLLIAGPLGLLLATMGGYLLAAAALAARRVDAPPCGRDLGGDARRAACRFRAAVTRSAGSPRRSTRCSPASRRPSPTSGASSPTRATSCGRRSRCSRPSSSSRCAASERRTSCRPQSAPPPWRPTG